MSDDIGRIDRTVLKPDALTYRDRSGRRHKNKPEQIPQPESQTPDAELEQEQKDGIKDGKSRHLIDVRI